MDKLNILNKLGLLTDEDRKEPLERGCDYFTFKTCLDLSKPVQVIPYGYEEGKVKEMSAQSYSRDLSSFMFFWTHFVAKDLNGFQGFHSVKFEFIGFKLI